MVNCLHRKGKLMKIIWSFTLVVILSLNGICDQVTIYRDTWGIPHIQSESDTAAAYALGYCQAEDRLEQIFTNYRKATGHMAEAFGERYIDHDLIQKTWRHEAISREYVENRIPVEVLACIEAFQDGIRAYMKEHPEQVPDCAMELHPYQAVAVGRLITYAWQQSQLNNELGRLDGASPKLYSNQWTVSPHRVKEKCAVLLIDPHLPWEGEYRFYENHMQTPTMKVCGYSVVGTPAIGLGHNEYLGWACTTGGPDTVDVYEMERNPDNPWQYKYEGEWRDTKVEEAVIPYKAKDGSIKEVKRKIYRTHQGPVIYDTENLIYAAKTAYDEEAGVVEQLYRMNRAKNKDEFFDTLSMLQFMDQNIMGADVEGNIFYVRNGRVPKRAKGYDWGRPVPGNTKETEWNGFHSIDDLIQIINPKTGYMHNCNVAPDAMAHLPLVSPDDYSREIFHARSMDTHTRGIRANQLLSKHENLTREEALSIVTDTQLPYIKIWKTLIKQVQPKINDEKTMQIIDVLQQWNGKVDKSEFGATAFEYLIHNLIDLGGWGKVGPLQIKEQTTLSQENKAFLIKGLKQAAQRMDDDFGRFDIPWGNNHRIERGGSWPVDGAGIRFWATLRPVGYHSPNQDTIRVARGGQSHALLVFFKKGDVESYSVTPYGISNNEDSPHYNDQTEKLFSKNKLKSTWFSEEKLKDNIESKKVLSYTN